MAQKQVTRDDRGTQFRRMAPGSQMRLITPNDAEDNCPENSTLYIGVGGDLVILPEGNEDNDVQKITVTDGQEIDFVTVRRVLSTETTADQIFAIF